MKYKKTIYQIRKDSVLATDIIKPYFVPQFINTTYACIEGRGMHKASKDVQTAMKSAKSKWTSY
ncbi:MAG: hypothetical protein HFJ48_07790, partial [Clostridia bacterium]|nr:hypothetical protein [Clostridia bacterium]